MERRDYLMRQIEEMGLFLSRLIGRLQKRKQDKEEEQIMEDVRSALSVQFGWDLEELLFLDNQSFISLMEENLLADDHYEKMASIFEFLGDYEPDHKTLLRKELYLRKALLLLEHLEYKSFTYSLERQDRIAKIKLALSR
ncbi:MAG: hypothetical protein AB2L24_22365 [Mangrovibacterium sp.]|jgi:hypothetical protein